MAESTGSEDTMILLATTPKNTDLGPLAKYVLDFFEYKRELDQSDRFNVTAFQARGPLYLQDFTFNPQYFHKLFRGLEGRMVLDPDLIGGIFVAITFIIDVFKKVGGKIFRMIVLTDKGTPPMDGYKVEVVNSLIDEVKELPFIMDIVRIGVQDHLEDTRLSRLAKRTNGDLYYVKEFRQLSQLLKGLAVKKDLGYQGGSGTDHFKVNPATEMFFANMADTPQEFEDDSGATKCKVCFQVKNEKTGEAKFVKCSLCNTTVHPECWAQWANSSNIGVPYLFRCHACFNLLKLDRDFVADVALGKWKRVTVKASDQDALLRARDEQGLRIVLGQNPFAAGETAGGAGGQPVILEDDDDTDLLISWCPKCNAMLPPEAKFCNKCGAKIIT